MGSVYTRGRKLWLRFKGPEGWTQRGTEFLVGQEQQARAVLEQLEEKLKAGELAVGDLGPVTVGRYFPTWLAARKLEISTWRNCDAVFRHHVLPTLGQMRLEEVRPSHLVALVKTWRAKMAPKSVWSAYSSLSAFFRDACFADLLATTPCILTARQLGPKEPKDPEFRATAVFSRDELERLVSDDRLPADHRVLYALQGIAGLRLGEAMGLRWRWCATPAEPMPMIYVAYSYGRAYPKGGKCRPVPVHPTLAAILAQWKLSGWRQMMGRDPTPDDLVLPRPAGAVKAGEVRNKCHSWSRFKADLAALGLRHRRGHDLRRTFISLARSDGARSDVLRRATHKPPPEVFEGYTTFEWSVVCAEVAKLRIRLRPGVRVIEIPRALAVGERALAPVLAPLASNPAIYAGKSLAHPGLEPGRP